MSAAKAVLRDMLRRERAALEPPYREEATARVNRRIVTHPAVAASTRIGGYAATAAELNIDPALSDIIATHGAVFLPRVVGDTLEFCACTDLDELTAGFAGIREPTGRATPITSLDLLLVPGVGFDPTGRRLGNGGGHYDRVLAKAAAHLVTIGVAFSPQIVPEIPVDTHDWPMTFVLTDESTYPQR